MNDTPKQTHVETVGRIPTAAIRIAGFEQQRDVHKVFDVATGKTEFFLLQTHHYLLLEGPTGPFRAEVTREDWDKHVIPACQANKTGYKAGMNVVASNAGKYGKQLDKTNEAAKVQQERWSCPFCDAKGWWTPSTHQGKPPLADHDRPDGRRCRQAEKMYRELPSTEK